MNAAVRRYTTRNDFDTAIWDDLSGRLHYITGSFEDDATYGQVRERLDACARGTKPAATRSSISPRRRPCSGLIGRKLAAAGFKPIRRAGGA